MAIYVQPFIVHSYPKRLELASLRLPYSATLTPRSYLVTLIFMRE